MRPIKALADELGVSERQFFRRIKDGQSDAVKLLRGEIVWESGNEMRQTAGDMRDTAELLERVAPELAGMLNALADEVVKFTEETEPPAFRLEHDRRLAALVDHPRVTDEMYEGFAADLTKLPPLPEEVSKRRPDPLAALRRNPPRVDGQ